MNRPPSLHALFHPASIALVGASNEPGSIGRALVRNLFGGGFAGPIVTVNPHEESIGSVLNYRSIEALPIVPELAIVATPAATVPGIVERLGKRGCRLAVIVTAGLDVEAEDGGTLLQAALESARRHGLRIVGPNCVGFVSPVSGINASFAPTPPMRGDLALVSQSGAMVTTLLDWATGAGVGFSHLIALGDMADVDFADVLDHLAADAETGAILLYVESIADGPRFLKAAATAAAAKPVLVLKGGRSASGARAALSHTGAMAGADAVYTAAFRRAGLVVVQTLGELLDAARLATAPVGREPRALVILTNGGGAGVLAADRADLRGVILAELDERTGVALNGILPGQWSGANPVDIVGDAGPERYAEALETTLSGMPDAAVLVMHCPTSVCSSTEVARVVGNAERQDRVMACLLGGDEADAARRELQMAGVPTYDLPAAPIDALWRAEQRRALAGQSLSGGPAGKGGAAGARALMARVAVDGRSIMTGPETLEMLRCYGVPTLEPIRASDPATAAGAAAGLGSRVALKILSPDISHKSDVGGVRLNLAPDEVEAEARAMLERIRKGRPGAALEGFAVEPMAPADGAVELIMGLSVDPTFGPVILFGAGGVATEVLKDTTVELAPLDTVLAERMIRRTRVHRLLAGYRNVPPADLPAVVSVLVALSRMALDHPSLAELDINPLLAGPAGVLAIDARAALTAE